MQAQLAVNHLNDFIVQHNMHFAPVAAVFDNKIHN
jgi:hypothetical protein